MGLLEALSLPLLWAIAAAIEHLAVAVDRLGNPLHDTGTH